VEKKNCCHRILPSNIVHGRNLGSTFYHSLLRGLGDYPQLSRYFQQQESSSDGAYFTYTNTQYGYGYGVGSTSITLPIMVLSIYSVIVILYLLYILITGSTSTVWNSAIEVIALALHSKSPDDLPNMTAGINCLGTFSQSVGIRVNAEKKLELVFANDSDRRMGDLQKIQKNKMY
jgi:hypothetical protein